MRFAILGPIELRTGGQHLPVGGPRQLALLAFLLLHANRAVSTAQLQEALWSEHAPAGALKRVHMAITRLRKVLAQLQPSPDVPMLRTVSNGYLLSVAVGELDADVFRDGVRAGRARLDAGDPADASTLLRAALGLWRGPALAEVAFTDYASAEIGQLEELRLGALESAIEADLALGCHHALVSELLALSLEHPEREPICRQLMLALYRCGRHSDALEAYQRLSVYLVGELGLHPGPAMQLLQRAVLEHASWLTIDAGAPAGLRDRAQRQHRAGGPPSLALPPALQIGEREPFVGRDAASKRLGLSYEQAVSGSRRVVLLSGAPGVGKSRLAAEFARQAHAGGAVVLFGRCDEEMLLPHQPFIEALRHYVYHCDASLLAGQVQLISGELRRVVPELAERVPELAQPLSGDPEGARHRLFEAVTALLCAIAQQRTLVLVLDDLHWADKATLLLLKYVARYPRRARLMVVGTYRDVELEGDHPLRGVLADLSREELFDQVALGCLDEGAVSELVAWHTEDRAPAQLRRTVFEQTEGNAFFVVEVLRNLAESQSAAGGPLPLPERVTTLIKRRFARLSVLTNRVLATASVLGQTFRLDMIEELCDLSQDEALEALERAVRAQIIKEAGGSPGSYAFSHALIRDVQYESLTATRRAVLHHRVALALEDAYAADLEPYFAELAHHFGCGSAPEDLGKAIEYGTRAGEHAVALLAYEQAAAHYRTVLALLDSHDASQRRAERCALTIAQGEAERMAGDPAYRETLLRAASMAQQLGDIERLARAALSNNRGFNSSSQGVDHDRVGVLNAALKALGDSDSATRASLLAQLAAELIADADWRHRAQLAGDALAMARRVADPSTLARVLTMGAVARWNPRTLAARNADLLEASQLAERGDERLLASYVTYFGCDAALEAGDLARADLLLASLGALVQQLGQPIIQWNDAVVRAKRGLVTCPPMEAERLAFAAYEIGQRAGQPDAVMWWLAGVFTARFLQGTLDAGEPNLPALFEQPGSSPVVGSEFTPSRSVPLLVSAATSAIFCEIGRIDDGRRHFESLMRQLADPPNDYSTLAILGFAAVACAQLRDADRARQLHALLEPYGEQFINAGSWFGAVSHHLAVLRATMSDGEDVDAQFAVAERAYERLGAHAWLARCRLDWAQALHARGRAGDLARADTLLGQVLVTARELDLPAIEQRAAALRRRAAA